MFSNFSKNGSKLHEKWELALGRFWSIFINETFRIHTVTPRSLNVESGPFEKFTFWGRTPASVVKCAKKKKVQVDANKETVTKNTRQRKMKRQVAVAHMKMK